ncbi:sugar kinase [bacterium]|nr:sugar kinase [bacterium]
MKLVTKEKNACRYDLVSLGEVMLRFDPGNDRIRTASSFRVWEGGGEYNVARGLKSCFGQETAIVTALVDNEIGKLVLHRIRAGGVDPSLIKWVADDGIGAIARNGLYFWESGFGARGPSGSSDRSHTAVSQLVPGDIDWDRLFGELGVRWFHTGGIFAGLSAGTPDVIEEAMRTARKYGTIVSYDLNFRSSLWKERGGKEAADHLNSRLLDQVDVLFGVENLDRPPQGLETPLFRDAILRMIERHPGLKAVASTMRYVRSATVNDWSGLLWADGKFHEGMKLENLAILDRVGGGDGFAAGLIYGFLESLPLASVIQYAVVHGALTMTTPGDNSMAGLAEVEQFIENQNQGISR